MTDGANPVSIRVALVLGLIASLLGGFALIAVALWQNTHNEDGHRYWPFMDLFGVFVLGCGLLVLAGNAYAWLRLLRTRPDRAAARRTFIILVLASPVATILFAVVLLHTAALVPAT